MTKGIPGRALRACAGDGGAVLTSMLFMDYSSTFNTVIPHKLTHKLLALGLHPTLCDWLLDILTGRPQTARIGNRTSASMGTPQGCVLSPILYTHP